MRNKLLKLLRTIEQEEDGVKNDYMEFVETYQCQYSFEEFIDFPNYRFVVKKFNDSYPLPIKNGLADLTSGSAIKAELKRMEIDGLIIVGKQTGKRFATTKSRQGPDFDEGADFSTESIVLTTKGRSKKQYFLHEALENPIANLISIIAIIISIIALSK